MSFGPPLRPENAGTSVVSPGLSLKAWDCGAQESRVGGVDVPAPTESKFSFLLLLFCGPSAWVRVSVIHLPIQMLICPQDALTDTPRDHVSPAAWAPLSPVKLTHGINHHKKVSALSSTHGLSGFFFLSDLFPGTHARRPQSLLHTQDTLSEALREDMSGFQQTQWVSNGPQTPNSLKVYPNIK